MYDSALHQGNNWTRLELLPYTLILLKVDHANADLTEYLNVLNLKLKKLRIQVLDLVSVVYN